MNTITPNYFVNYIKKVEKITLCIVWRWR